MDREPASARTFERCSECLYKLPTHKYGCSQDQRMDRRSFLSKAGSLAAAGGLGALAATVGLPVSSSPATPWNQGAGSMQEWAEYVIYQANSTAGGTAWYRRDGDTGKISDSSEGDSPTTDPVPLINRAINSMTPGTGTGLWQTLIVKGGFSSATTLLINNVITYRHYGVFKYTGTGNAVSINIPYSASGNMTDVTGAIIEVPGPHIYIGALYGPNNVSPFNASANAFGLYMISCIYGNIEIGRIQYFTEAVRVDASGTGSGGYAGYSSMVVDNNILLNHIRYCNTAIHLYAGGNGGSAHVLAQTNHWKMDVEVCAAHGFLQDDFGASNNAAYQELTGIIDNHGDSGAFDYENNTQSGGDSIGGNFLCGFFNITAFSPGAGSVLGPKDIVIGQATFAYISGGGLGRPTKSLTGQTGSVANIATYPLSNSSTAQADAVLLVGGMITITSFTSNSVVLNVTYTDSGGTSRTKAIGTANAAGDFPFADITIYAKKGTNVVISTTQNGTSTYNVTGTFDRKQ